MAELHSLTRSSSLKTKRRVGRGGKRGKTSGHGHKGQKQHGGHGIRPEMRDMIKKLPKLRGHGINRARTVNSSRVAPTPVNLAQLEASFASGDAINPQVLVAKGIVNNRSGKAPKIKILGLGVLKKKLTVTRCTVSVTARKAIEDAGGSIVTE